MARTGGDSGQRRGATGNAVWLASGVNVVIGLWLVLAPFALTYAEYMGSTLNAVVVGIVVILLAGTRLMFAPSATWPSWLNVLFGLWLIAGPFVFGNEDVTRIVWNHGIAGAAIAILGLISALTTPKSTELPPNE